MDYGRTTKTEKTVKETSTASGVDFANRRSPNRFDSSVNIIAPTIANIHFRMQAKKLATNKGSLK